MGKLHVPVLLQHFQVLSFFRYTSRCTDGWVLQQMWLGFVLQCGSSPDGIIPKRERERDTWCIRQVPLKTWKSPSTVSKWRSRNVPFGSSCAASSDTSTTAFALNLTPSAKFFCPICLSKSTHVHSFIRILQKTCQTGRRRILLWQPQPIAFTFIKNANWANVQPWCSSSLLITKLQTEFKK